MMTLRNERGIALVISLLILLIVAALSAGLSISTRGGQRVATAFQNQQTAFAAAVAGLERAREAARANRYNNAALQGDFDAMLTTAAGGGGALVNSASLNSFSTTDGLSNATNNVPLLSAMALNGSSYQVFLTNAGAEAPANRDDTDDTITLTSFASAPNRVGFSVVQGTYRTDPVFTPPILPGNLTMPGPNVIIDLPNGNSSDMDGNEAGSPPKCYATVAFTTATARNTVSAAMTRPSNYHTCNPNGANNLTGMNAVDNFISGANPYNDPPNNTPTLQPGDTRLTNVAYLTNLVSQITQIADYVGTDNGAVNLGTWTAPRIVVVNGDYNMPGSTYGSGALVVTGTLSINGTPGYRGSIYVIGTGAVVRLGGGNGVINCGGMLIANTVAPFGAGLVGVPSYTINGGGTSLFQASCPGGFTGSAVRFGRPMQRLGFQQLR